MLKKKTLRKMFNDSKVQLTPAALQMIDDDIKRKLSKMVSNCKEGNVKRLTPETYHIAIGKWSKYLKKIGQYKS